MHWWAPFLFHTPPVHVPQRSRLSDITPYTRAHADILHLDAWDHVVVMRAQHCQQSNFNLRHDSSHQKHVCSLPSSRPQLLPPLRFKFRSHQFRIQLQSCKGLPCLHQCTRTRSLPTRQPHRAARLPQPPHHSRMDSPCEGGQMSCMPDRMPPWLGGLACQSSQHKSRLAVMPPRYGVLGLQAGVVMRSATMRTIQTSLCVLC